jgi:AraC family transcriptional regulator
MRLDPGTYLGRTLRERTHDGLTLTLSAYRPGQSQPWHVHANPTFFVLLSGHHRDRSPGGELEQPALSLVFHPTTESHATEVGPQGMLGLNVEYESDWLERYHLGEGNLGGYRLLGSPLVRLAALRALIAAFRPGGCSEAELEEQALHLTEPLISSCRLPDSCRAPRWLGRADDFLQAHFRTPIGLRDVARETRVHPVYLARVFRRFNGCSVGDYIRSLRLAEAGRLIVRERYALADAAHAVGFFDQAHLTRWCSRELGFSPKVLRATRDHLRL